MGYQYLNEKMIILLLIKKILEKHNKKISVAESISAGNLQSFISSISGASNFFEGGLTAYSIIQKVNLLKINKDNAEIVNCVSEDVALEMSKGCSLLFNTDFSISTTGYAEKYKEYPPHAYISIYDKELNRSIVKKIIFKSNNRQLNQYICTEESFKYFFIYLKERYNIK